MQVGIVSDTHGNIHPAVFDHLEGVDLILHAGDIGGEDILLELETIAPVKAVLGNTDSFPLSERCGMREIVEVAGRKIFLAHRVIEGGFEIPGVMNEIKEVSPDVVVFGHTHDQFADYVDGVLFFNPGSAGQRRPGKRLAVGILALKNGCIRHELHFLE